MERVLIIGCPGSGKSFLARRLAEATGLPAIHLDRHFWGAGWVEPDPAAWRAQLEELVAASAWIIDGNYTPTLGLRLARADTAILLDVPGRVCLRRVIVRALRWLGRHRGEDMAPGCRERIDLRFMLYVLTFSRRQRGDVMRALENFSGTLLVLKSDRDVAALMRSVAARQ